MWRSVGTVVGLAGVVGWSAGCVGRPDTGSQAVAWADPALADSATPHVFPPDDILIYPKPDDPFALAERIAYGSASLTKLPPDYLYPRLKDAVWYHQRKQIAMPQPPKWELGEAFHRLASGNPNAHAELLAAVELEFIHASDTSSLDRLGLELSQRFREFDWQHEDYPGGTEGPGEAYAFTLAAALDGVTPERRANRTAVSVITRDEATDDIWQYMLDQWTPVPGEDNKKLNRHAVASYLAMRDAAAADGIDLVILSGHRDPKRAAANAARVGNSFAVASFSSHSQGLAIDVVLPRPTPGSAPAPGSQSGSTNTRATSGSAEETSGGGRFKLTTRPMADVVDMRRSPVHKWLHLHAHRFGWYPFQHEPWHWEYNPPAFRDVFFADYPDGAPRDQAD